MSLLLLLVVSFGGLFASPRIDQCCTWGATNGVQVLLNDITCREVNKTLLEQFTRPIDKFRCQGFLFRCCEYSAKSEFCNFGVRVAKSNGNCEKSSHIGGDMQETCCKCCKEGMIQGRNGGSCSEQYGEKYSMCQEKFEECCKATPKETGNPSAHCTRDTCDSRTSAKCVDEDNGPKCQCKQGFKNTNRVTCLDENECLRGNVCQEEGKECQNKPGSYKCVCKPGYNSVQGDRCVKSGGCERGFEKNINGECVDIDECKTGVHRCPERAYCLNTEGDYTCPRRCSYPRYKIVATRICEDVNECLEKLSNCAKDHRCVNQVGGYKCVRYRCDPGYQLIDGYCQDIDECQETANICGEKGRCRNAYGRYFCDCQRGYDVHYKHGNCTDIDECTTGRAQCSYKCKNLEGSFRCICPAGYENRGNSYCYDIDECKSGQAKCKEGHHCFNTFGSYACLNESCPNKYFQQVKYKSQELQSCQKINNCYKNAYCQRILLQSVKRLAYRFHDYVRERGFVFNYYTSFNRYYYDVDAKIVSGNTKNVFKLRNISHSKLEIFNQEKIRGRKEFHLVLKTKVYQRDRFKKRSNVISWEYEIHLYVFVSQYNFS